MSYWHVSRRSIDIRTSRQNVSLCINRHNGDLCVSRHFAKGPCIQSTVCGAASGVRLRPAERERGLPVLSFEQDAAKRVRFSRRQLATQQNVPRRLGHGRDFCPVCVCLCMCIYMSVYVCVYRAPSH